MDNSKECSFFLRGSCKYGKSCRFLHSKPSGSSDYKGGRSHNTGGGNNTFNQKIDPNLEQLIHNHSLVDLNEQMNSKLKLYIDEIALIGEYILMRVKAKEYCVVFNTKNSSFESRPYYLHSDIRDDRFNIYTGRLPGSEVDTLMVSYTYFNDLLQKRMYFS